MLANLVNTVNSLKGPVVGFRLEHVIKLDPIPDFALIQLYQIFHALLLIKCSPSQQLIDLYSQYLTNYYTSSEVWLSMDNLRSDKARNDLPDFSPSISVLDFGHLEDDNTNSYSLTLKGKGFSVRFDHPFLFALERKKMKGGFNEYTITLFRSKMSQGLLFGNVHFSSSNKSIHIPYIATRDPISETSSSYELDYRKFRPTNNHISPELLKAVRVRLSENILVSNEFFPNLFLVSYVNSNGKLLCTLFNPRTNTFSKSKPILPGLSSINKIISSALLYQKTFFEHYSKTFDAMGSIIHWFNISFNVPEDFVWEEDIYEELLVNNKLNSSFESQIYKDFSPKYFPFMKKYGYINQKGEIVVPPVFSQASVMKDINIAIIHNNQRRGVINNFGEVLFEEV